MCIHAVKYGPEELPPLHADDVDFLSDQRSKIGLEPTLALSSAAAFAGKPGERG
jgi:hypothetical protein